MLDQRILSGLVAHSHQRVTFAYASLQALGHCLLQCIAGVMPERVVDCLDPVQVKQKQGKMLVSQLAV